MAGERVYVPGSLPGETVLAVISGERAHVLRIENRSPERIEPFCKHFGQCGGCQLQHWQEEAYRQWKRNLVVEALRHRKIEAPVNEIIDAHGQGRRRVSLHVRRKDGKVTAGFMAARTHTLLDVNHCPVLVPALGRAFEIARAIDARLGDCDVALTATGGGLDVAVKASRKLADREMPKLASFVSELDLARLAVNGDSVAARYTPTIIMGRAQLVLPVNGFLQATAEGEQCLARLIIEAVGKAKSVGDLFSGCGPFALRLAETATVTAIDSDRQALAALSEAARGTKGLKPVTTSVRNLYREPLTAAELNDFDAVVFDPPRAGAEAEARQLARSKLAKVIAVSCDPPSFARDASILLGGGYHLEAVTPVDQFKWTSHVEIVGVFQRSPLR